MSDNLADQFRSLPDYFGAHVVLTTLALGAAILVSMPLGIVAAKSRLRWFVLAVAGVLQTIPGLALLALMVLALKSFGFWPAFAALVVYGLLPILRNTVTGLCNVDRNVVEAAHAVGMTKSQVLREVELPLALPVIVAGIRTAAVWIVGVATLSTPVGQQSLGNYIFGGLQTRNFGAVLFGCALAALLAVLLDFLLGVMERAAAMRSVRRAVLGGAGLAVLLGAGALSPVIASRRARRNGAPTVAAAAASSTPTAIGDRPIRIGAKTFTEQYILGSLIEERLTRSGLAVERLDSLGSTIVFDALSQSRIDVYVDYTGTIWANHMKKDRALPGWNVQNQVAGWLAESHGIRALGALGFENAYALAMRKDRAQKLGVASIADLAKRAPELRIGGDYEFFQRPEWTKLEATYGLRFAATRSFDPAFMYSAVAKGEVDVISAFSSDGRIAALDLLILADPKRAFPPYDAVLLLAPSVSNNERVTNALLPLVGGISVERMRTANWMVDRDQDKKSPHDAALWLMKELTPR